MPIYPINETYEYGFFDNKVTNGRNDREYSAKTMREPYAGIFSDGVKPNANGVLGTDLQVKALSGMQISITAGRGMFGGAWFKNKSVYNITLDTAGSTDRYDCVIVRRDDSEAVRATTIYIKPLTAAPTKTNLIRTEEIQEFCLAYVKVPALATEITQANITDTRLNQNLCGVITGVYKQLDGAAITAQWEAAFNGWFDDVKDSFVASATLIHTYTNATVTDTANQKIVEIGIPQYNSNLDILIVSVEGRVFTKGTHYKIVDNTKVEFTTGFPVVGTQVLFQVLKSVDGSQAETVVSQVNTLINTTNAINKTLEHHYYCNGVNDNILISQITRTFYDAGTTYDSMKLVIHGTFGASTAVSGEGTSTSPYIWFRAGQGSAVNRRVFLDFTDCSRITINCADNSYNTIFFGLNANIIGANVIATGGANITMFSTAALTYVNAEHCRFWITSQAGYIARGGCFRECRVSLTTNNSDAYCFNVLSGGVLRLFGGEFYSYAPTDKFSTVVYVNSGQTGAVVTTYSISCPTNNRSGYVQTYAVNCLTSDACCSFTDTITTLGITAEGQNIRGTIAQSKPNLI